MADFPQLDGNFCLPQFLFCLSVPLPFAGSETVLEVVISSFQRLCKELKLEELTLMWHCVYQKIAECLSNEYLIHLSRLLSLLISTVQINNGHRVFGEQ